MKLFTAFVAVTFGQNVRHPRDTSLSDTSAGVLDQLIKSIYSDPGPAPEAPDAPVTDDSQEVQTEQESNQEEQSTNQSEQETNQEEQQTNQEEQQTNQEEQTSNQDDHLGWRTAEEQAADLIALTNAVNATSTEE